MRRQVTGAVNVVCRPGPPTVLTESEEQRLAVYIADMAEMGFKIIDNSGRQHPFVDGLAGRAWFEGFKSRRSNLTIQTPHPLSYNWATCANKETIEDFFPNLVESIAD